MSTVNVFLLGLVAGIIVSNLIQVGAAMAARRKR